MRCIGTGIRLKAASDESLLQTRDQLLQLSRYPGWTAPENTGTSPEFGPVDNKLEGIAPDSIRRPENTGLLFRQHPPKKGQGNMQVTRVPLPATMTRQSISDLPQLLCYRLIRPKSKKETL